jgi:CP family cyanate transporter-like MFS transporter
MQEKTHSVWLLPGIIAIGLALRIPFVSLPPILAEVAAGLNVPVSSLGLLTTLPLLAFALISPFAANTARRFGIEGVIGLMLLAIAVGSTLRLFGVSWLFIGTAIIGIGVAHLNVLLPTVLVTNLGSNASKYTAGYLFSMMVSTVVALAVVVPITKATSWEVFVGLLTLIVVLVLIVWLPNLRYNHMLPARHAKSSAWAVWRTPAAWLLLVFGGLQSLVFYTLSAWLPTMMTGAGVSATVAGLAVSLQAMLALPFSFLVPAIAPRLSTKQRQMVIIGFVSGLLLGIAMLFVQTDNAWYWFAANAVIGLALAPLFPYLMTLFALKAPTPSHTAELSGMAQSGGYLLAALGPALFGAAYGWTNSWAPQIIVLLILTVIMAIAAVIVEKYDTINF